MIGNTLGQAIAKPVFNRFFRTMESGIEFGRLDVRLPDGSDHSVKGSKPGPEASVVLNSWGAIPRIAGGGELGLAEVYMDGLVDTPDLKALMDWALTNQDWFITNMRTYGWSGAMAKIFHFLRPNSKDGSRRNIADHYDLGNAFYSSTRRSRKSISGSPRQRT